MKYTFNFGNYIEVEDEHVPRIGETIRFQYSYDPKEIHYRQVVDIVYSLSDTGLQDIRVITKVVNQPDHLKYDFPEDQTLLSGTKYN
jgi:hypothetical protein